MMKMVKSVMAVLVLANAAQAVEYSQMFPFNVGSRILSFRTSEVIDARFNPPRVIRRHFPEVIQRTANMPYLKAYLFVKNLNLNVPWEGENVNVQIKHPLIGKCLTVTGHPSLGPNSLQLEYLTCEKESSNLGFRRQVFFLRTNGNRASALESSILRDLGISSTQLKCVERLDSIHVGLRDCAGVGNWIVTH